MNEETKNSWMLLDEIGRALTDDIGIYSDPKQTNHYVSRSYLVTVLTHYKNKINRLKSQLIKEGK